ncbi:MAG: branched chain amino acid aminotransferase [Patescibacteria group bacterium]|nr:MAG: branched chain amino acid aminotransferase [Patescibacteria group bacterium]
MKYKFYPYCFFNGKIVSFESAKVSVATKALQYGMGVFGGIRGYYRKDLSGVFVFRLSDHYKRFLNSLKILGVKFPYSHKQLVDITVSLIKKNAPKSNFYLRPFAYADSLGLSPNFALDSDFDFTLYMLPLEEYLSVNKGLKVKVSSFRRLSDNAIPSRAKISGAYVNSALASKEAVDNGCDEAIFLTEDGHIAEGSAENLFIVRNNTLITSPVSDEILEGITRETVMYLAKRSGINVVERKIDRSELYVCDEAFFSGTGVQISWIKEIDGRTVGNGKIGKITKLLQDLYFKVVQGFDDETESLRTFINLKK